MARKKKIRQVPMVDIATPSTTVGEVVGHQSMEKNEKELELHLVLLKMNLRIDSEVLV